VPIRLLSLALFAALLTVLTGCADDGDVAAGPTSAPGTATPGTSGVEVSTDTSAAPEISVPDGDPPSDLVVETVVEGDGEEVEAGDLLLADYTGVLWDGGEEFDSSWSRGEGPASFGIGTGQVIDGWDQGLVGQQVGDRVLLVIPPDLGYGEVESGPIPPGSTLAFVVDIRDTFSGADAADGTPVSDLPDGLPEVTGDPGGPPEISVEGVEPPEQSRSVVVVEGSGEPIDPQATIVAHAVQASLTSGEVLFSSWDTAPVGLDAAALPGMVEALEGANAGTRVVTLISADDNEGDPLVLVVDVLASY
jgi:peptidylprolyl isomerase